MDGQMTRAEQNLLLMEAAMPANEKFYIWCYGEDGHFIAASCPERERDILDQAFRIFCDPTKMHDRAVSS